MLGDRRVDDGDMRLVILRLDVIDRLDPRTPGGMWRRSRIMIGSLGGDSRGVTRRWAEAGLDSQPRTGAIGSSAAAGGDSSGITFGDLLAELGNSWRSGFVVLAWLSVLLSSASRSPKVIPSCRPRGGGASRSRRCAARDRPGSAHARG